jgi:hypothetical protein
MDEGECGFLIGAKCKADPNKPFIIDKRFHDNLKIVGCASWSKYLDYGREHERTNKMQELPVKHPLGGDRDSDSRENRESEQSEESPPVHVLQEGNNDRGEHPGGSRSVGSYIIPCFVCQERATTNNGLWYLCDRHGKMDSDGKTLREIFSEGKERKNNEV